MAAILFGGGGGGGGGGAELRYKDFAKLHPYEKGGMLRDTSILHKAIDVWTDLWCNLI